MNEEHNPKCTATAQEVYRGRVLTLRCSLRKLDHSLPDEHYDAKEHEWFVVEVPDTDHSE